VEAQHSAQRERVKDRTRLFSPRRSGRGDFTGEGKSDCQSDLQIISDGHARYSERVVLVG